MEWLAIQPSSMKLRANTAEGNDQKRLLDLLDLFVLLAISLL
jgi:hypothetical protein